jgi:DNA polymerase-3 subunit alpha
MKEQYGIDESKSEEDIVAFIQVIEDASSYLFSLNHSQPYSYEGYVSGYLRTYYPLEFLTTALNINKDKEEKTKALTAYAKKCGITFQSPKFRHSRAGYFCDKNTNTIYKGIGSIKFMNETVANELYGMTNMQFSDFIDILTYLKENTSINSRQLDILIKIDYFAEFGDINELLYITEKFDALYGKKQLSKDKCEEKTGLSIEVVERFAAKVTEKTLSNINMNMLLQYITDNLKVNKCTLSQKLKYQIEHLGYIEYINGELDTRYIAILDIDTTYSPKFKAYCLKTGQICDMKIHRRLIKKDKKIKVSYAEVPIENGDVIYMSRCDKEPKQRKIDGEWQIVPNEFVWWINDYRKVLDDSEVVFNN